MPNTNYTINGVDLDTQLEPIGASTPIANTGFNVNGTDLSQLYASGTTVGYPYGTTNLISGTDIGLQLAGKGSIPKTYGNFQIWGLPQPSGFVKTGATKTVVRSWTMVSTANGFAGGIDTTGALYMWGIGTGAIGTGDIEGRWYPYKVGASSWAALSVGGIAGGQTTMAIRSDGALFAWGNNNSGQLGLGDTTNRSSPVQIGSSSWTSVSVGASSCYAIRSDNTLWAWGSGSSGALGQNNSTTYSSPVQIGTSSWAAVVGRKNGAIAKRSDGIIFSWGFNDFGQIGDSTTVNKSSPVQIGSSSWNIISTAVDYSFTGQPVLAIDGNGRLFAWGGNNYGQLGDGTTVPKSSPIQIGSSSWSMVNAGCFLTFGKTTDGTLYAWGNNQYGGAGTGLGATSSPVAVTNSVGLVSAFPPSCPNINGNESTSFFLDNNSLLYSCGGNAITSGSGINLAISGGGYNVLPTLVPPPLNPTGAGGSGTSATLIDVVVYDTTSSYKTFMTHAPSGTQNFSVYIDNTGKLFTWGINGAGQLGDGTTTTQNSPVQIGSSSWTMVVVGLTYIAAIRSDGLLFTWGSGTSGRLGDGAATNRSSPVQIGTDSWRTVAAGNQTTYAIRQDGTLWAWGSGSVGALGDGTTVNKSSPVQIGTNVYRAISQAPGNQVAAAIRGDGKLFTWGNNNTGQLGDGTTTNRSSPVQIGNDSWTMVACGISSTFAIRSDGALFAWGFNNAGQLGDGTTTNRSSPVQIGNSSWAAVAAMASFYTVGALTNGNVYAWGGVLMNNASGNISIGDGVLRTGYLSSPVLISTLSGNQGPQPIPFTANGNLFLSGNFQYNTQGGYVGRTV